MGFKRRNVSKRFSWELRKFVFWLVEIVLLSFACWLVEVYFLISWKSSLLKLSASSVLAVCLLRGGDVSLFLGDVFGFVLGVHIYIYIYLF